MRFAPLRHTPPGTTMHISAAHTYTNKEVTDALLCNRLAGVGNAGGGATKKKWFSLL